MASFLWKGNKFYGFDPSDAELQSQTTPFSCWAACIVNASTLLYGKFMGSDRELLEKAGLGAEPTRGLLKHEIKRYVELAGEAVGVGAKTYGLMLSTSGKHGFDKNDTEQDRVSMVGIMNNCLRGETPYPFIVGMRSGTTKASYERHTVLLMAVNDQDSMYLIHEPAMGETDPTKKEVSVPSIMHGMRFLLPIERRMIGKK